MSPAMLARTLAPCFVALASMHLGVAGLEGQTFDGTVFAGAALMTSDLTEEFELQSGETAVQTHDNGFAIGAHLGLRWSALQVEGTVAVIPTDLVTEVDDAVAVTEDQRVLMLGASVLYNFPGRFVEFFLAAGGGVKSYSADDPAGGFEAGSDVMYDFGGGARIYVTESVALRADLRDYVSTFDAFENTPGTEGEAQTQHDVLLTIGLSWRAGG